MPAGHVPQLAPAVGQTLAPPALVPVARRVHLLALALLLARGPLALVHGASRELHANHVAAPPASILVEDRREAVLDRILGAPRRLLLLAAGPAEYAALGRGLVGAVLFVAVRVGAAVRSVRRSPGEVLVPDDVSRSVLLHLEDTNRHLNLAHLARERHDDVGDGAGLLGGVGGDG